jgi:hypothetical protein
VNGDFDNPRVSNDTGFIQVCSASDGTNGRVGVDHIVTVESSPLSEGGGVLHKGSCKGSDASSAAL